MHLHSRAVAALLTASVLLGSGSNPSHPLDGIDPKDPRALLAAGIAFEKEGRVSLAMPCYRRILKLGVGDAYAEAAFRLGSNEYKLKEYESAWSHIRDAAETHGHKGAWSLLDKAQTSETKEQWELLAKGNVSFEKGDYREAKKAYETAWARHPSKPSPAPFVPRNDLLRRLARCADVLDDENYKKVVQPAERSIQECRECSKHGGFTECGLCNGTGFGEALNRLTRQKVRVACGGCKVSDSVSQGTGWVFCKRCVGFQHYTESASLKPEEKKAIRGVIDKVRSLRLLSGSLPRATAAVEEVFLGVDQSSTLDFFRSMKPAYKLSQDLQGAAGAVPPTAQRLKEAEDEWKAAGKDVRIRSNFLISYAIEYSRWLRHFEMLRKSRKTVDFAAPPVARSMTGPVTPEVLSAFPDEDSSGWTAVTGYFESYFEEGAMGEPQNKKNKKKQSADPSDAMKGRITLQADLPHNVNFFTWLPAAAEPLKRFATGQWSPRVSSLGSSYPFGIREKVSKVPPGHRVILAGRFLRDRLGYPRNWFEVWDVHVGLTREAEAAYAELAQPVTAELPSIKASDFGRHVHAVYGVEAAWRGSAGDELLQLSMEDCPVGLVLDEMAKALGVTWDFEPGKALMGSTPSRRLAPVLEELRARNTGKVSARKAGAAPAAPLAELPDDSAALKTLAEKASSSMDYRLAARCWESLLSKATDAAEKARLKLLLEKTILFHELTGATPRNGLVGRKEIARVTITNKRGDVSVQTVHILEEKEGKIRCVTQYGGELSIDRDQEDRSKRQVLSGNEWSAEKDKEMKERLKKLQASKGGPREVIGEHFLLALFAKAYGFEGRGTGLLEKVLGSEEFPWLASFYFPREKTRGMVERWKDVTGRKDAPPPPEPAAPPASVATVSPSEKLPDSTPDLLPYARRHRDQARAYMSQSLPGMSGAEEKLKLARDHFRASQNALEKLSATGDADPAARSLSREVSEMLQICTKGLGFFD